MSGNASPGSDPMLLSARWGALWGLALGAWLLAPTVLDTHHLRPWTTAEWLVVLGSLALSFAALGASLAFVGGLAVAAIEKIAIGSFTDRTWAYGLFTGLVVIGCYAIESAAIHWVTFRSARGLLPYGMQAVTAAVGGGIAAALLAMLYRQLTRAGRRPAPLVLACCLCLVATTGGVALVARESRGRVAVPGVGPLQRAAASREDVPLLFVGLDGATWRVLQPAIANGSAPTLKSLVTDGVHGRVDALWPPYWSGAAWASIVTGLPREITGVYEDLAAIAPGVPVFQVPIETTPRLNPFYAVRSSFVAGGLVRFVPPPRQLLRGKPVWQLLYEAGVRTAVVRWRFTHPPAGQGHIVITDWVGQDQWDRIGVHRPDAREGVVPVAQADHLLAPFRPRISDPSLLGRLLPGPRPPKPADALADPIDELAVASDIDNRTFEAGESILRSNPSQSFLAMYIGGLDSVEHAFWQYRFPEDFPTNKPAPRDIEHLGPVLDRYVAYIDDRLRRLMALYATPPNIVIVSDHGQGPTTISSDWRGWHTKDGVFIAAGPSVPSRVERSTVSYYDVVPTIAWLKGFEKPAPLTGRVVIPEAR